MRAELEPLGRSYDVVVANPPYMGAKNMNKWLSGWVKDSYPDVKGDLFSCFMVRNSGMGSEHAQMGFMTPYVWMFIGTYEKLRRFVIEQNTITSLIQLEYSGFAGATVPICTFTLEKGKAEGYKGGYIRLSGFPGADQQAPRALEALADPACGWFYRRDADTFKQIPGSPIAYWVSQALISSFGKGIELDNISDYTGSQNITADNELYLRRWWEPSNSGNRWIPYSKGGNFRRWFGNHEYVVDWSEQAKYFYKNNSTSNLLNERYWFQEGITYSDITSGRSHFRFLPAQGVFDKKGPEICMLGKNLFSILAFLNSSVCQQYLYLLNPSMTLQVVDVKKLPLLKQIFDSPIINGLTKGNINLSCSDWDSFEISWDFKRNPLV
ncbi:Eco57I restriction-modification methylase domain-containing protein [Paratractidigestivibacter faecalis]|uniref:Eco57I restriction-modification methylase domain-containing protein n=1 Tax=Paratractidigestivibacter faecalis TaxID=2292441 RepID=UPI00388F10AD